MADVGAMMGGDVSSTPNGTEVSYDKPAAKPGGDLSRMVIEPTGDGGFHVTEYYKPKGGRAGAMSLGGDTKTSVAKNLQDLDGIIDDCFGMSDAYDQSDSEPDQSDANEADEGE